MMDLSSSDRYSDVFMVEDDDALSLIGALEALLFEHLRAIATVLFSLVALSFFHSGVCQTRRLSGYILWKMKTFINITKTNN